MYGSTVIPPKQTKSNFDGMYTVIVPSSIICLTVILTLWSLYRPASGTPSLAQALAKQEVYMLRHGESEANVLLENWNLAQQYHCNYAPENELSRRSVSIDGQEFKCDQFVDAILTQKGVEDGLNAAEFWREREPKNFELLTSPHRRSAATLLLSLIDKDLSSLEVTVDTRLRELTYFNALDCELKNDIPNTLRWHLYEIIDQYYPDHKKVKAKNFVRTRWKFNLNVNIDPRHGCHAQDYVELFKDLHSTRPIFIAGHSGMMRCITSQIADTYGNQQFDSIGEQSHIRCCLPDNGSIWNFEWHHDMFFVAKNNGYIMKSYGQCEDNVGLPSGLRQICEAWKSKNLI